MQACPSALQLSLHMDLTNFLKTARSEQHGDSALQGAIEVMGHVKVRLVIVHLVLLHSFLKKILLA